MAAARARLWSSFRRRSESPLLAHQETKREENVSCLFGSCRLFPDSLPASCAQASAPSPARPGGGADKPLGLVSAARRGSSVRESLRFALRNPVAVLSSVAPKLTPSATRSLRPRRGS
ncbi:hypothetical protein J1605_010779 [Eschrichtius robustus]|uniref:Uncharacterized protein n=1 Tax=Eschrichtius robustus TaxID=9764 RepID=A0AB34GT55_ESCRO|nr:hypothetical protein J1605_010779 [Eschrichtius robustus]